MTAQNRNSAKDEMKIEAVPAGRVDYAFLMRVERYQEKKFQRVGRFDPDLLKDLVERITEIDTIGEIDVLIITGNKMHDGTTSGLIVFRCNQEDYFALAGLTDHE